MPSEWHDVSAYCVGKAQLCAGEQQKALYVKIPDVCRSESTLNNNETCTHFLSWYMRLNILTSLLQRFKLRKEGWLHADSCAGVPSQLYTKNDMKPPFMCYAKAAVAVLAVLALFLQVNAPTTQCFVESVF